MLPSSSKTLSILAAALLVGQAAAKTDIAGCVSSKTVVYGGASLIWYVPDTGEICEFLDCGGGRAPPKTTVPGCAAYEGTATYSPSFLPGFGAAATPSSTVNSVSMSTSVSSAKSSETTNAASPSATITTGPTTTSLGITMTMTSNGVSSASTGNPQGADSTGASSSTSASGSTSVSQAAAAMPTAFVKGAVGAAVGFAAGVAML
ncbi:hypothetical protein GGS26DRAFT_595969 [Hypomontagnella submonticulosa]|nr:hypothetical protein GGS26DRAFT_595969 [Hypomontagnella submonticulosa]